MDHLPNEVSMGHSALKTAGVMGGIQEATLLPYWEIMVRCIIVKGQFMDSYQRYLKRVGAVQAGLSSISERF